MGRPWQIALLSGFNRRRRALGASEAAFIVLATFAGVAAGVTTNLQQFLAHTIQGALYGVSINRLSALGQIHHPWRLLALPLGGLVLVGITQYLRARGRQPIDVIDGNALHGGRIPLVDNFAIAAQTIVSNGAGASVGLEATFAQMGGGLASLLGQWFKLRRSDLRTLVGAGAGAAIGAAFGAPLTGAFYAFEVMIGTYTPAAIAPVVAASLAAVIVTRGFGVDPYLIATTANRTLITADYLAYAPLGLICALLGIAIMRLATGAETHLNARNWFGRWRPVVGGFLLIPIALVSPQSLSAGHGAMHLDLTLHPELSFLVLVLGLKILASVISLGFGFRGGLFFASLFLGSLVGQIYAGALGLWLHLNLDPVDAALIGMAGLSVSIIGGPMTLAILILETTHDFALMGIVLTVALVSSAVTRELFGYSFSTWRLHIRGSTVRSPRDIGWMIDLAAGRIMRRDWTQMPATATIGELRSRVPPGSTSKVVLVDAEQRYCGIVATAAAWSPDIAAADSLSSHAILCRITLEALTPIAATLDLFDLHAADELAVVDADTHVIGVVGEKYARRRYFEGIEAAQREIYREA